MNEPTQPPALKQPSPACRHEEFNGVLSCNRYTHNASPNSKPLHFMAEVRVQCAKCGGDFMFTGLPWILELGKPGVGTLGTAAMLPLEPWSPPKLEDEIPYAPID